MGYRTLQQCTDDLLRTGRMIRIETPIDPHLEMAAIQRRVFAAGGPGLYFDNVIGCDFPMTSNIFGTMERLEYIFRDSIEGVRRLVRLGADPADALRHPRMHVRTPWHALCARPRRVRSAPVLECETTIDRLPQLVSWPGDGGPYVTLPQVYTEDPNRPGWIGSNLGMYRVQLAGNEYEPNEEVGLHYQIHRGIAAHHAAAIERDEPLKVNIFIGGAPAMSVAAVMPLPEGMSELMFAGLLGKHPIPMRHLKDRPAVYAQADFCIQGYLEPERCLPEGPFGDHLGYYSLAHDFPVLKVERVTHRPGAIWPFTVVGRPPQEDSMFGRFIHELVGPAVPAKLPGVQAVHAVDEAGVHPLLLAVANERYVPYERPRRVRELLTAAHAILGFGQLSLAKYLFIAAAEDDPAIDPHNIEPFLAHVLRRFNPRADLHFETRTTIDTLDYSSPGLNEGSKLVIAAAGSIRRELPTEVTSEVALRPALGFDDAKLALPGVLVVKGPAFDVDPEGADVHSFIDSYSPDDPINRFPLIIIVDDADFTSETLSNFLWTTFTRSNPATDVYGIGAATLDKHWGCEGSVVIDARIKPHHAPPLIEDPDITRRVEQLAAKGGPLDGMY
jgi:4-hydroxy-3-polyprenylbenzoate decarboxylase